MVRHFRSLPELLDSYRDYLLSKVSKVRILGEADERELRDVFVELSVVDQRVPKQRAQFLGLMDSAMRRRFNPFADVARSESPKEMGRLERFTNRRIKADDLLRRRTKAIVTGAPGCGKTTLLKYLALQAQEREERLVVWVELKGIDKALYAQAEKAAKRVGNLILQELWLKHLKIQLAFNDVEIKLLRGHWQERFKANQIVVLLDGFDELQDEVIERSLNKCVREFASASHENALLISTRPYSKHKLGKEHLQELEIEPLNPRQIEAFLYCYYPDDVGTKSLLKNLHGRSSLSELLHVPLLLGVILRLHREKRFTDDRLTLYETIISDLVHELDRSKSVARQFKIKNERLRLDFLKFLAFERLLRDSLFEEEQVANRIVFSYELLKEKARRFVERESLSHNPRDLADDVLATPLLREVGADNFAFTHLTLQEYLAAVSFATFYRGNEFEGTRVFCRAYHNPTLVEMEVLPMILGATHNSNRLYDEIERWPDSLTLVNLRLRARGLAYLARIKQDQLLRIVERFLEFISWKASDEIPYREIIVNSFADVSHPTISLIEALAAPLIKTDHIHFFTAALALGQIGSAKATDALVATLKDKDIDVRSRAVFALGKIGSSRAVEGLIYALSDKDCFVRQRAAEELGDIGSDRAVPVLTGALKDKDSDVRSNAVVALGQIGSDEAVDALVTAIHDRSGNLGWRAAFALGRIGSIKATDALIATVNNHSGNVRSSAAQALGWVDGAKASDALICALTDQNSDVKATAAEALGAIGSDRATDALILTLRDGDSDVRLSATKALGQIRSDQAVSYLISVLNSDEDMTVRSSAATALGKIGSDKAEDGLISALKSGKGKTKLSVRPWLGQVTPEKDAEALNPRLSDDKLIDVRLNVITALGEIGSDRAADVLISLLNNNNCELRSRAANALRRMSSERAVEALISALKDDYSEVRQHAAEALGAIGSDRAADALICSLNDRDSEVRSNSAYALGQMDSDKAIDALISTLDDHRGNVRRSAALALGHIGSAKAVDALVRALDDEVRKVRTSAVEALGKIDSDSAAEALISILDDGYSDVVWRAVEVLGQMRVETLTSVLTRMVREGGFFAHKRATAVVGYYSNDYQRIGDLRELATGTEDHHEINAAARDAAAKFRHKMELLGYPHRESTAQSLRDNESREQVLIGEVYRIVGEAGHLFSQRLEHDWGLDGEIEFKNEAGEASGQRVYLQLKSGDSYLRKRKRDGKEVFTINKQRHARYWQSHAYHVLLVIRDSGGGIRWMNVTEYLQRHGSDIKQIEFQGESFTAGSVNEMRNRFAR